MDNLNLYQNTFAPNSSSSTNFYTQKNFHPRQEASLSNNNNYDNNLNQENSINNNQGMGTVSSNKRTFKNNINEYSPSSQGDRRKNKMLKLVKNSLVQRVKNNVLLKEINHAYNEMGRFSTEGDLASSKMMENELNELQHEVIMTNLYPITKYGRIGYKERFYDSFNSSKSKYNSAFKNNMNNERFFEMNKTNKSTRIRNNNNNNNIIDEENNVEEEENINRRNFDDKKGMNQPLNDLNNNGNINNIKNSNVYQDPINNPENQNEKANNNLISSKSNNKINEYQEPNNIEDNNKLNNIQNNEPNEIINNIGSINDNNNIQNNKRTKPQNNQNENYENNNYRDYEERNISYEYEDGMYYYPEELDEVYEESEFNDNNKKQSKISKILEKTRKYFNNGTNPNYNNQEYPYNISPQNNLNNKNLNSYPQLDPNRQNKGNIPSNLESQNISNSQTFNPSQNMYPGNPNDKNPNYPNTLYQNNLGNFYPSNYPNINNNQPEIIGNNANPNYNLYPQNQMNIPGSLNKLNYPNYPQNNQYQGVPQFNNKNPLKNKPRPKSVKNIKPNRNYPYSQYDLYNTEYPQRPNLYFGEPLAAINNKFRTKPLMRRNSPANIPYSKGSIGKCFACDVDCGISRSGNSPNNYDPYMASLRKPRLDVTFFDAEKFGFYQYSSPNLIPENN